MSMEIKSAIDTIRASANLASDAVRQILQEKDKEIAMMVREAEQNKEVEKAMLLRQLRTKVAQGRDVSQDISKLISSYPELAAELSSLQTLGTQVAKKTGLGSGGQLTEENPEENENKEGWLV